jgi:hypothetical protein
MCYCGNLGWREPSVSCTEVPYGDPVESQTDMHLVSFFSPRVFIVLEISFPGILSVMDKRLIA